MGWTNSHLHAFRIGDQLYGMQFDEFPEEEIDETSSHGFAPEPARRSAVRL